MFGEGVISSHLSVMEFLKQEECGSDLEHFCFFLHFGPWYPFASPLQVDRRELVYMI